MHVLRKHPDGQPRVYRSFFSDKTGRTFEGVVKIEREPEAWWKEFEVYYTLPVGRFLVPVIGHIANSQFVPGLPLLQSCDSSCPTARDLFNSGDCSAPVPGLCPIVLMDCGRTISDARPLLNTLERLDTAAKLVDSLRSMKECDLFVTDLKLENMCLVDGDVVFIDPGSFACGKTVPVTSAILLGNWLRESIRRLPVLEAALVAFAAEHPVATADHCVSATACEIVSLSAKIAIAHLLDFGDAALVLFQSIDHIFNTDNQKQIQICVGSTSTDYRDFTHFFAGAGHLVV